MYYFCFMQFLPHIFWGQKKEAPLRGARCGGTFYTGVAVMLALRQAQ